MEGAPTSECFKSFPQITGSCLMVLAYDDVTHYCILVICIGTFLRPCLLDVAKYSSGNDLEVQKVVHEGRKTFLKKLYNHQSFGPNRGLVSAPRYLGTSWNFKRFSIFSAPQIAVPETLVFLVV